MIIIGFKYFIRLDKNQSVKKIDYNILITHCLKVIDYRLPAGMGMIIYIDFKRLNHKKNAI